MRTSGVPRGLLRFLVLKLLAEKPMSGVEIVDEISQESGERWKPSSGSIYPLLAQLQNKGYTEELPIEESGMKRYTLTKEGAEFFKREIRSGQKFFPKTKARLRRNFFQETKAVSQVGTFFSRNKGESRIGTFFLETKVRALKT